ncbi:MAG: response regulator transcription factor [Clostridiales bacterium]|nr:response regulator transcription factor [Clostridiales bacterium]
MFRIAICDDDPQQLQRAELLLRKYSLDHLQHEIKIHSFHAPLELLSFVTGNGGFDLLLLDVYMDGISGTDAARELRDMGDNCQIIFLTTSRDHAIDAFTLNAAHYLVKPYSDSDFFSALDKVMEKLAKKDEAYITVKAAEGICRIDLGKLIYSETNNHLQKLYLSDGRVIGVRKSSNELFELLEEYPCFYKCGSTYIINMNYIVSLSARDVVFSSGARIPILSRKYTELRRIYLDYSCSH